MIEDKIIAEIEKELLMSRLKQIDKLPHDIKVQLKRIEERVFKIWNLDSVYMGQIRIDCFNACANSIMTLDILENLITKHGNELSKKYDFEKSLKKIIKLAKKSKGQSSFSNIKRLLNVAITRNKS